MDETDREISQHNICGKCWANVKHKKLGNQGFFWEESEANLDWGSG